MVFAAATTAPTRSAHAVRRLVACGAVGAPGARHAPMPWWGKNHWKVAQVAAPLLPIPLGCWFLYKAILSFNRSPPPIATTAEEASHKLYPEPVYQSFSFRPSPFAENASSREAILAARRER